MISCTEFIPLYSELFKFLEKAGGYDAVMDYWYFICEKGIGNKNNKNSKRLKTKRIDNILKTYKNGQIIQKVKIKKQNRNQKKK